MLRPLPDFSACRVLVIGDVMLDRYWHGSTARISPEAPVPVVKVEGDEFRAGGAGNVALNTARLGCRSAVIGLIGDDEQGRILGEQLNNQGVDCRLVAVGDEPTITKLRVISRHQQLIRLDFEERFHPRHGGRIVEQCRQALGGVEVLILSDYAKGTLENVAELIALARESGVPVVVDPKGRDFSRYRGATILKPNLAEFEAIVGPCADEATLVERGMHLRAALEVEALLITRSERGVTLIQRDQPVLHLPAHAREVFDVTGAGDTVSAVLGCSIAAGLSLREATSLANLAAGIVVGKLGTASVSVEELKAEMLPHAPPPPGAVSVAAAVAAVAKARDAGERPVLALGPFAPFDTSRLTYIEAAASLGERLLLAPRHDDPDLAILPALRMVDWVVPVDGDAELLDLIEQLRPETVVIQQSGRLDAASLPPGTRLVCLPDGRTAH